MRVYVLNSLGETVCESEFTNVSEALEVVRVFMKPSVFGLKGFKICIEKI